jgi:hypothetical protein
MFQVPLGIVMKRQRQKNTPTPLSIIVDIKREVPQSQLASIGALALAFNEVEATLDRLFFITTSLEEHLQHPNEQLLTSMTPCRPRSDLGVT